MQTYTCPLLHNTQGAIKTTFYVKVSITGILLNREITVQCLKYKINLYSF